MRRKEASRDRSGCLRESGCCSRRTWTCSTWASKVCRRLVRWADLESPWGWPEIVWGHRLLMPARTWGFLLVAVRQARRVSGWVKGEWRDQASILVLLGLAHQAAEVAEEAPAKTWCVLYSSSQQRPSLRARGTCCVLVINAVVRRMP